MTKTPQAFYNEYNGKVVDYDGAYGAQCVDGFKVFCKWAGIPVKATPNNWADGYWYSRDSLGFSQYFEYVVNKQYRNGDWVIWARNSVSHPSSHIAMWYQGKEFGENQGGNRGFCLKSTNFNDALGALRWKGFGSMMKLPYGKSYNIISTSHGNVVADTIRGDITKGYDLHMITADGWNKVQGIETFDSDKLTILGGVNGNYFQMSDGCHLGCEGDGTVLGYSQEPKQEQWLALYQKDGQIGICTANDYWYKQTEIDFVCSPYCTRIVNGGHDIRYSKACNDKDDIMNEQTAIMRFANGDWAISIFSKCYPREVEMWALELEGIDLLALMDSGGSTQMFCCTSGTRQIVRNTGRKVSDCLVLAKKIDTTTKPDVPDANKDWKSMYHELESNYTLLNEACNQAVAERNHYKEKLDNIKYILNEE